MTAAQQQEIMDLRALKLTPKQIARKLGMKVSLVNAVIQNQAQQATLDRLSKRELEPIYVKSEPANPRITGGDRAKLEEYFAENFLVIPLKEPRSQ